ncbi:MAG: hypothetical protein JSW51_06825 [Gemmatimonadota bacterium]|nr:MAG: hypothetical protein JSW51_06825 [Gemmatimonadota bacterium]
MDRSLRLNRFVAGALVAATLIVSACDKESLQPPTASNVSFGAQPLFTRYVAMGNSITSGIQSAGINDSLQLLAYPVLLASQMGLEIPTRTVSWTSEWNVPLMRGPGCPAPYTDLWTQTRLGGTASDDCAYRSTPIPTFINNVAYAGATALEQTTYYDPAIPPSVTDVFRTFLLGGSTPFEVVKKMQATFVTVWSGSTDIDDALTDETNPGDPSLYPDVPTFTSWYTALMDSLNTLESLEGGVLIGAVNVTSAPYVSPGGAYFLASQQPPLDAFLTVLPNCLATEPIPGTALSAPVYVPFHYGAPIMGAASAGVPTTLDCSVDEVISAVEARDMIVTVAGYNAAIEAAADARGWPYWDPNVLLLALQQQDPSSIRLFPAYSPADPQHDTEPFGWALSLDGLHPSSRAHGLIADALIIVINTAYSAGIPVIFP